MSNDGYLGACFCGAVEIEVRGTPVFVGFCRCESCRTCTVCGGHAMNAHPSEGIIDVLAPILRGFAVAPTMHVH